MPRLLNKTRLATCILVTLCAIQAKAVTLADSPLFLGTTAIPNVMYILDDSTSMISEVMPETLIRGNAIGDVLVYPWATNVYATAESTWLTTNAAVAKPLDLYGKVIRSKNNTLYYDPSKLYKPWIATDGEASFPDADPLCALHNPRHKGVGQHFCRNLTLPVSDVTSQTFDAVKRRWVSCANSNTCTVTATGATDNVAYYPATYYRYSGTTSAADVWTAAKYTEVQIISTTLTYTGDGRGAARTDCTTAVGVTTCTYVAEMKNFANWYTYYRSRILTARAGSGFGLKDVVLDRIRMGYAQLNVMPHTVDGTITTRGILDGVRTFNAATRTTLLTHLYDYDVPYDSTITGNSGGGSTPLRTTLAAVGLYYSSKDIHGPWADDPGLAAGQLAANHASCRKANTILMTDGYWNDYGQPYNVANVTTLAGNADNTAGENVTDDKGVVSNTYAVRAPFKDSQSDSLADVAMQYWKKDLRPDLTNNVPISASSVDAAFWQHMTTYTVGLGVVGTLAKPDIAAVIKNATTINWPSYGSITGANPEKIDDLMHAAINGHGDYFNAQDPDTFAASLKAILEKVTEGPDVSNASAAAANSTSLNTETAIFQATFNSNYWSGSLNSFKVATGGVVGATAQWTSSIPAAATRKIFTVNASGTGTEFLVANKANFPSVLADNTIKWIRGEAIAGLRSRIDKSGKTNLLGDIVNSGPAFAGKDNSNYDRLSDELGGSAYATWYKNHKKDRREVVYVGANDGMLHAINASSGKTLGEELFAYIPSMVYDKLTPLTAINYSHRYSVDGPIAVGDAYWGGAWHNILVGTLGAGGRGIYVLDVTNPDGFSNANVLFELDAARYPQIGNIMRQAVIAPGKDNRWKIFIGNGYNSSKDGLKKAYFGVIDIESEVAKIAVGSASNLTQFIATNATDDNGLALPALLPDNMGRASTAYAGDLYGNLWRFSSNDSGVWSNTIASSKPLFIATDAAGKAQPITASPTLGINTVFSPAKVMVYFGTGRYLSVTDQAIGSDVQSFYAIADSGLAITGRADHLHEKGISTSGNARTITNETTGASGAKTNLVKWVGDNRKGWYVDFPAGERIITQPLLVFDRLFFPTLIPSSNSCTEGGSSWLMELQAVGKNPDFCLTLNCTSTFSDVSVLAPPIILFDTTPGTPGTGAQSTGILSKTNGSTQRIGFAPPPAINGRLSWRELQ